MEKKQKRNADRTLSKRLTHNSKFSKKVVLIGGYPKGYPEPFHIKTKSGKVLRAILENLKIKPNLLNLWQNAEQEKAGELSRTVKSKIKKYSKAGFQIIALGKYQEKILLKNNFQCSYLPHPASRRKIDIEKLRKGLYEM